MWLRKPLPVHAMQWTGDNTADVITFGREYGIGLVESDEFMGKRGRYLKMSTGRLDFTLTVLAVVGDFIIAGRDWPVGAGEFLSEYDEVKQ